MNRKKLGIGKVVEVWQFDFIAFTKKLVLRFIYVQFQILTVILNNNFRKKNVIYLLFNTSKMNGFAFTNSM